MNSARKCKIVEEICKLYSKVYIYSDVAYTSGWKINNIKNTKENIFNEMHEQNLNRNKLKVRLNFAEQQQQK